MCGLEVKEYLIYVFRQLLICNKYYSKLVSSAIAG